MATKSGNVASKLQSGVANARKQLEAVMAKSSEKVTAARQKAADAALGWVLAHEDRIAAFRRSLKGTPIEKIFERLLALLRSQATPRKAPAKRRRPAAKKAAKKTARSR